MGNFELISSLPIRYCSLDFRYFYCILKNSLSAFVSDVIKKAKGDHYGEVIHSVPYQSQL